MMHRISLLALAALSLARPALATLGGAPSAFSGARQESPIELHTGFHVREAHGARGARVREYVADGKVFAVAWNTAPAPDLAELLGPYLAQVREARAAHPLAEGRSKGFALHGSDLVFEQVGTLRGVHGLAYLRSQMPMMISEADIHE